MLLGLLPLAALTIRAYNAACRRGHCQLAGHPAHTSPHCPRCRRRTRTEPRR